MTQKDQQFSFGHVGEDFSDATQRNLPKLELAPDMLTPENVGGYNPYERDATQKSTGATQRTDLRKLSEWIKLKQQVEAQKAAPPEVTGEFQSLDQDKPKR